MTDGVVNITPMTDIFLAHWLQNANLGNWFTAANATTLNGLSTSQRDAALTRFRNAMPLLTGLQSVDPITSAFNAAAGDTMDDMLEAIKHARSATSSNHADDLHNVTQGISIVVSNNYYTALVWKYRQTTSGASATGISYANANIVTTAPGETYAAASEDESAFNLLNAERARCGYGYLSQDTRIDAAARAHADYQLINWTNSHYETFGNPGFTGQNGGARIGYQGYSWAAYGDNISMKLGSNSKTGYGEKSVRDLLSAPFHSNSLLGFFRDVGFGIRNNVDAGSANSGAVTQINLAYTSAAGKQEPASDTVLTYPCQGTTGVNYQLRNESPNPVPNRDLWNNPLGHPILMRVKDGQVLSVTSATMTHVATNTSVTLRSVAQTKADDTNGLFRSNEAYVIPDGPLTANATYSVTISGTNAQVPFTKTFTFTTGSGG